MYYVTYTNEGRREHTPAFATRQEAAQSAEFLRFQGAKRVQIKEGLPPRGRPPRR